MQFNFKNISEMYFQNILTLSYLLVRREIIFLREAYKSSKILAKMAILAIVVCTLSMEEAILDEHSCTPLNLIHF